MRTLSLLSVAVAATFASSAMAVELPQRNTDAECHKVASEDGDYSAVIELGCRKMNAEAKEVLETIWNDVSEKQQRECVKVASSGGFDYVTLLGCIKMEAAASAALNNQK